VIDGVVVLRATRGHKTGRCGDFPPSHGYGGYCMEKTKPNITKSRIHQSIEMHYNTKSTQKLQPGLVAFYDIRPGKMLCTASRAVRAPARNAPLIRFLFSALYILFPCFYHTLTT